MLKDISNNINLIDSVLVGSLLVFTSRISWETASVVIASLLLKSAQPLIAKAPKRDEIIRLDEQLKKISGELTSLKVKLGFSRPLK